MSKLWGAPNNSLTLWLTSTLLIFIATFHRALDHVVMSVISDRRSRAVPDTLARTVRQALTGLLPGHDRHTPLMERPSRN